MAKPAKKKSKSSKKKPPKQTAVLDIAEERDEAGPTVQAGFLSPVPPLGMGNRKRSGDQTVPTPTQHAESPPAVDGGRGAQTVPTPTQHAESPPAVDGGHAAQTMPSPTQQGGSVRHLGVTGMGGRYVKAGGGLDAVLVHGLTAGPRINLSDPSAAEVKAQLDISRQKLEQLQKTLEGLHGIDAPGNHNTQEVPFPEEELQTMRTVVAAAITLHETRVVSRPIVDTLENFRQIIEKFGEILKAAAKAGGYLTVLAGELYVAAEAIEAFINKVTPMLGG